jgi:hypothetical protein
VNCIQCGDPVPTARTDLGYRICLLCGEEAAREERRGWTIVPMHKSNYVLLVDRKDLPGIGNKGGLHR